MTRPSRGDIVWVTFPDIEDIPDDEMDDPHMGVVLQNNGQNQKRLTTIVVPISSGPAHDEYTEVDIRAHSEDVPHDSHAILPLTTVISVEGRIMDVHEEESAWKQGELSNETMHEIEQNLSNLLRI